MVLEKLKIIDILHPYMYWGNKCHLEDFRFYTLPSIRAIPPTPNSLRPLRAGWSKFPSLRTQMIFPDSPY